MNTTFKRLTPGATYKAHLATKARVFVNQLQQVPSAPLASGAASVTGDLTLDLPVGQELLVQDASGRGFTVLNSTTRPAVPNP